LGDDAKRMKDASQNLKGSGISNYSREEGGVKVRREKEEKK